MRDLRFGEFCWFKGEGWIYQGMVEDGNISLVRPMKAHPFNIIEHESVWMTEDDDYDSFCEENGESFTERCLRKGVKIPEDAK